jgi:hypothetical protein
MLFVTFPLLMVDTNATIAGQVILSLVNCLLVILSLIHQSLENVLFTFS